MPPAKVVTKKVKSTGAKAKPKGAPKAKAMAAPAAVGLIDLADQKLCLRRLSKDMPDGSVMIRNSFTRTCTSGTCLTITRGFNIRARITNAPCDDSSALVAGLGTQSAPRTLTASLKSVSLGQGANATQRNGQRGFHVGTFRWNGLASGSAFLVTGSMNGMTNVGTVRGGGNPFGHAPASCRCEQKCSDGGFMEGQMFGTFTFQQKQFQLTASYRINYDPSVNETDPQCNIHAAIEGVLISPCPG